jgi:hypothetical protein
MSSEKRRVMDRASRRRCGFSELWAGTGSAVVVGVTLTIEYDYPFLIDVVAQGRAVDRGVPKNIDHEGRGRLVVQPSGQFRDRLSIQLAAENTDVRV